MVSISLAGILHSSDDGTVSMICSCCIMQLLHTIVVVHGSSFGLLLLLAVSSMLM